MGQEAHCTYEHPSAQNIHLTQSQYVNAIANELFISVAASLANRMLFNKSYYLGWASKGWDWFSNSGLINEGNLINDGLDLATCQNNQYTTWTYNQGVILGGLVELSKALGDDTYLEPAISIATATMKTMSGTDGILREPCEPNCGDNGSQFKGIFMRNLQYLQEASPSFEFESFIQANAMSIWESNRGDDDMLGLMWAGPYDNAGNAATQSSALEALIAAVSTLK